MVARCRKALGQKRVGHGGTLDPDATGLLLVGVGRVTRLLRFLSELPKGYEGELELGSATTTLDASGEVTGTWDMSAVSPEEVEAAAARLTGPIMQVPPMVSAVHVDGRRLHELAREGRTVERKARPVRVERFTVSPLGGPGYAFDVVCSSGTYVRSLVDDLGRNLGGGAHLRRLRRVSVGPFRVTDAVPLDAVGPGSLRPPVEALAFLDRLVLQGDALRAVSHGRKLSRAALSAGGGDPDGGGPGEGAPGVAAPVGAGPWAVVDPAGELVAVYEAVSPDADELRAAVVLAPA